MNSQKCCQTPSKTIVCYGGGGQKASCPPCRPVVVDCKQQKCCWTTPVDCKQQKCCWTTPVDCKGGWKCGGQQQQCQGVQQECPEQIQGNVVQSI